MLITNNSSSKSSHPVPGYSNILIWMFPPLPMEILPFAQKSDQGTLCPWLCSLFLIPTASPGVLPSPLSLCLTQTKRKFVFIIPTM